MVVRLGVVVQRLGRGGAKAGGGAKAAKVVVQRLQRLLLLLLLQMLLLQVQHLLMSHPPSPTLPEQVAFFRLTFANP